MVMQHNKSYGIKSGAMQFYLYFKLERLTANVRETPHSTCSNLFLSNMTTWLGYKILINCLAGKCKKKTHMPFIYIAWVSNDYSVSKYM